MRTVRNRGWDTSDSYIPIHHDRLLRKKFLKYFKIIEMIIMLCGPCIFLQ